MPGDWTRDQLLLTFNLYCKIQFAKTKANNPAVIEVARLIGRSSAAVAMKLGNFGSFDPALQAQGISGLKRASKADRGIWDEFQHNAESLAIESEMAADRFHVNLSPEAAQRGETKKRIREPKERIISGPSEALREVKVRLHQRFFRDTVLASYGLACSLCGNPVPELLIAAHIINWAKREDLRVNPRNGICLCSLHHAAFDCGFWCVDNSYGVVISKDLRAFAPNDALETDFIQHEGTKVRLPDKFWPEQEFLEHHRRNIFRK